jgi:N12 class adenine-specific DNA methylase
MTLTTNADVMSLESTPDAHIANGPSPAAASGPIGRARTAVAVLELLDDLDQHPGRTPTTHELNLLAAWPGWGPLAPALEPRRSGTWRELGDRIGRLLPEDSYRQAVAATSTAFYTSPEVADGCWSLLTGLGFAGGTVLEPGCGAGVFMARAPRQLPARFIGVERDPTTARIAGLLHPHADIRTGLLQETPLANRSVDAVIGNVPFADVAVYDPTVFKPLTRSLHNYFLHRSIQALRPGGIAVLITSRYTLDAAGELAQTVRHQLAMEAELLGAIRLPSNAFAAQGTQALTDILVLRRRIPNESGDAGPWLETRPAFDSGVQVNGWLLDRPEMILGELAEDAAPRYGRTLRVDPRPDDPPLAEALHAAGQRIVDRARARQRMWRVEAGASAITDATSPFPGLTDGRKEGSFHLLEGIPHEVRDGQLVKVERPGKELPALIELRDAALELMDAEADHHRPDAELEPLRRKLNARYDRYLTRFGPLNRSTLVEGQPDPETGIPQTSRRRPRMGGFRRDPHFVAVLALEDFDDEAQSATKAALLRTRVNRPRQRVTRAETPTEAVAICRDELGRIDLPRVADLLDTGQEDAAQRIGEHGLAFRDPATGDWQPADEYLSGDVRAKLIRARAAAANAPELARNVAALEQIQPADLAPEDIYANLGSSWIPASDVQAFAVELLRHDVVEVWCEPRTSTWSITAPRRARGSALASSEWGTDRLDAYELLERALNGKAAAVYDEIVGPDGIARRVRNQEETLAAEDRQSTLRERFATWVWEDPGRADRLAAAYNRDFNATVPRRFDGGHLTFPGIDPDFEPYQHQRDMVARMIAGSDSLCPFPVGTGKTATMFMAAMKMKQLGLVTKPLIVVVPSTLEQIARDGKRLFPAARILLASREDLADARSRKLFTARAATGDWDAIVMSHPAFTSLPVHAQAAANYLDARAGDYRAALSAAQADGKDDRKIKQIAKMIDRDTTRAKNLLDHATDDGVFFEHLGVDYVLLDEMHFFKNLGVPVHTDGFSINGSKRAEDLAMKLRWLRAQHPDRPVITGFTGTPFTNTLLEAFIMQHYLQPARLAELGIASADAWAANFVRFTTAVEVTPDGGFRLNRRPAEIVNIPELAALLGEFAEFRPPESFEVKRPDISRHTVTVPASDLVRDFVHELADRADAIHGGGVSPKDDNILKICSDGRKVALHPALVGLEPDAPGKIESLTANVVRIHQQTNDLELAGSQAHGGLQLVFCDLGTPHPKRGNQVYGIIRDQLAAAGIPRERIRFIHEATTDNARQALFDACNRGEVSVLLGSTDKMGVGVNVQRRAIALHHVDAPWRPDQVEQRDGRIWRPGNLNQAIDIYRYVTEGSFDAFMWQALERKERGLRPLLSGQFHVRSIEDIGEVALDYAQIKAVSTGNPLLLEANQAAIDVKRLTKLASAHHRAQRRLNGDIAIIQQKIQAASRTADALEAIADTADATPESTWRDANGATIGDVLVPGALAGHLATVQDHGYTSDELSWRGLAVKFARHDFDYVARVTTPGHRVTVPVNPDWTAKGQHWRIRDAITTSITTARDLAGDHRQTITELHQEITEAQVSLAKPFAHQAELETARSRKTQLDTAIRTHAEKEEQQRLDRASRPKDTTPTTAKGAIRGEPATADERRELLRRLNHAMASLLARRKEHERRIPEPATPSIDAEPEATIAPATADATAAPEQQADDGATPSQHADLPTAPLDTTAGTAPTGADAAPQAADRFEHHGQIQRQLTQLHDDCVAVTTSVGPRVPADIPLLPELASRLRTPTILVLDALDQLTLVSDTARALFGHITLDNQIAGTEIRTLIQDADQLASRIRATLGDADPHVPLARLAASPPYLARNGRMYLGEWTADGSREVVFDLNDPDDAAIGSLRETSSGWMANPHHGVSKPHRSHPDRASALIALIEAATTAAPATQPRRPAPQRPSASTPPKTTKPTSDRSKPARISLHGEHALDLALQGFAVFPVTANDKTPLVRHWPSAASTDPQTVITWWRRHPRANIGIACEASNLFVIDLDIPKNAGDASTGESSLTLLAAGRPMPATRTVTTPSGGTHLYFRPPPGIELGNTVGDTRTGLGHLIDTRGVGGFVVAPGSTIDGRPYQVSHELPIAPLPEWLTTELTDRRSQASPPTAAAAPDASASVSDRRRDAYGRAAMRRAANTIAQAAPGTRNHTLNREAFGLGQLVGAGVIDHDQAESELLRAARQAGLPDAEARATATSGMTAGIAQPRSILTAPPAAPTTSASETAARSASTQPERTTSGLTLQDKVVAIRHAVTLEELTRLIPIIDDPNRRRAWERGKATGTLSGSYGWRHDDEPDAGASSKVTQTRRGIEHRVDGEGFSREGRLTWREVTRMIRTGLSHSRAQAVLDTAAAVLDHHDDWHLALTDPATWRTTELDLDQAWLNATQAVMNAIAEPTPGRGTGRHQVSNTDSRDLSTLIHIPPSRARTIPLDAVKVGDVLVHRDTRQPFQVTGITRTSTDLVIDGQLRHGRPPFDRVSEVRQWRHDLSGHDLAEITVTRCPVRGTRLATMHPTPPAIPEHAAAPTTPEATMTTPTTTNTTPPSSPAEPPQAPDLATARSSAYLDALRTLYRLGPTAIGLEEEHLGAVRQGLTLAAQVNQGMTTPTRAPSHQQPHKPDAASPDLDDGLDQAWNDVQDLFAEHQATQGPLGPINGFDDVSAAIAETRAALAAAPIHVSDTATAPSPAEDAAPPAPSPGRVSAMENQVDEVDRAIDRAEKHLAVDIPADRWQQSSEWQRAHAIRAAIHNLWETIKHSAGDYLTELAADTRLHGLIRTLTFRACRAIEHLTAELATKLAGHTLAPNPATNRTPQPVTDLLDAYRSTNTLLGHERQTDAWRRISTLTATIAHLSRNPTPEPATVAAQASRTIADLAGALADHQADHGPAWKALRRLTLTADHLSRGTPPSRSGATTPPTSTPTTSRQPTQLQSQAAARVAERATARIARTTHDSPTQAPERGATPRTLAAPSSEQPTPRPQCSAQPIRPR